MTDQAAPVSTNASDRRGAGYLYFFGILQIGAGIISLVLPILGLMPANSAASEGILNPQRVAELFAGQGPEIWTRLIAGFVSFQLGYGWIFGILLISSGICCMGYRARGFVWISTVINLINVPHGTTAALMTWHGLNRSRVSNAFQDQGGSQE